MSCCREAHEILEARHAHGKIILHISEGEGH